MEAVLSNVRCTVELLAAATTSSVSAWSDVEARRALSWSRYCQHIHHRFHTHPAICGVLEKTLRDANRRLRDSFEGYEDVALWDLSRCQDLLVLRMLRNPATPTAVLKMLFEPQGHLDGSEEEDGIGHCLRVVQYKSACKVLRAAVSSSIPGRVSGGPSTWCSSGGAGAEVQAGGPSTWCSSGGAGAEVQADGPSTWCSSGGAEAEVQGEMLMERLDALLLHGPARVMAEQFLDSIVAPPTCWPPDHVCRVIAAALLLTTRRKHNAEDVFLSWLQRNEALMQRMCWTLSSARLAELLQRHQNLTVPYLDLLKNWASHMTYDLNEAQWVSPNATDAQRSFSTLTRRLRALLSEACPSLRDSMLEDLNRLKVSDGDFDVRGLSVWTDLLSDMKT